ncbi:MAG: RodZ domain-containing protein, partial [bacterium]
ARREEYGWSIKDVARALRLSERQIEAVEEDDYELLPGKTYVMGYWRSYAQLLQIDIDDSVQVHRADISGSARDIRVEHGHQRTRGSEERSRKRVAILFACLLAVFLCAVWLWQNPDYSVGKWITIGIDNFSRKQEPESMVPAPEELVVNTAEETAKEASATNAEPQLESVLALPVPNFSENQETVEINTRGYEIAIADLPLSRPDLVYQEKPELESDSGLTEEDSAQGGDTDESTATAQSNQSAASQQASTEQTNSSASSGTQQAAQSTASESGDRKIVFKVEKESWIDVRDATGERLIYRTVNRGEDIRLQGQPPYSVFIGSAEGVSVQYQGREVPFKAHESGLFARFEVGN